MSHECHDFIFAIAWMLSCSLGGKDHDGGNDKKDDGRRGGRGEGEKEEIITTALGRIP